jgi:hypothetical protein
MTQIMMGSYLVQRLQMQWWLLVSGPPTDPSGTGANSYIVKYCEKSANFLWQKMLKGNFLQALVTSMKI